MWLARSALALAVTGVAAAGCGSGGRGSLTHDVKFDVGGRVGHLLHPDRPLSGATVTLTDVGEDTETATTASNGLWTEANLRPGPYIERFELAGYEPMERELILAVGGENDIENVFVGSPDAFLQETRLRATSSPFGVEIRSGETYRDGFSGHVLQYSVAAHGSITLTFDRDVIDFRFRDSNADVRRGGHRHAERRRNPDHDRHRSVDVASHRRRCVCAHSPRR